MDVRVCRDVRAPVSSSAWSPDSSQDSKVLEGRRHAWGIPAATVIWEATHSCAHLISLALGPKFRRASPSLPASCYSQEFQPNSYKIHSL